MVKLPTSCDEISTAPDELAKWHATAMRALDASDRLISEYFRKTMTLTNKLDSADAKPGTPVISFDPVTEADRGAERIIRDAITSDFPTHGIVGEEFANKPSDGPVSWIIDPIDGTAAFVAGLPTFGTLLGVLYKGVPIFGVMSQPFTGERFWGDGSESNYKGPDRDHTLATSEVISLGNAILATTNPDYFSKASGERRRFDACGERARIVRYGGDCYNYCLLAAGHIDLVIESGLQSHDIAALIPVVEGAGGIVTNWTGGPAHDGGQVVAAATAALHREALEILGD